MILSNCTSLANCFFAVALILRSRGLFAKPSCAFRFACFARLKEGHFSGQCPRG